MPASVGKKVKKKKNTTYSAGRFNAYPAGEFFTFYFKLPRFAPVAGCLHYHFEEGHLVSQRRGNCCFASDLLNSLGSSVTAAAYSHRKAGKLVRGGSGDQAFRWDWTGRKKNGRDKLPPPTFIYIYLYLILLCCNSD